MSDPSSPVSSPSDASVFGRWLALGSVLTLLLALCGSALRTDTIFAFRDSGLFYFPLFEVVRAEWLAGHVPLWNPWLNGGQPLAAAGTSSVFYPGQLLFLLPLPYSWMFNAYILLHLLGAAWGSWALARSQGASTTASALAALTYAFSGGVLFQSCNVVFLCGAAWFPFGLLFGLRWLDQPTRHSILWLGMVLAMLVLAGDPQAAYHVGLVLGVFSLVRLAENWRARIGTVRLLCQETLKSWGGLLAAAMLAGLLAMIQISLTLEFSGQSERNAEITPLTLWKVPRFLSRASEPTARWGTREVPHWYDAIIGRPAPPAKHFWQVYGFSIEPYRALEFIWPHFSGQGFPEIARWTAHAGIARPDVWTLSLYCGLLPFFLACSQASWLRGSWLRRSWTWLLLLSFVASWGEFGPVGLCRLFAVWLTSDAPVYHRLPGDEVGGLYWLMVTCLPGYDNFRFPGKWLTVTALAVAQLAALGLDRWCDPELRQRGRRVALLFLSILGTGVVVAAAIGVVRFGRMSESFPERAVWLEVLGFAVFATVLSLLARWWSVQTGFHVSRWASWLPTAVVALTVVDLAITQRDLVLIAPADDMYAGAQVVDAVRESRRETVAGEVSPQLRLYRLTRWSAVTDDALIQNRHQAATLSQNIPWLHHAATMHKKDTLELNDFTVFFDVLPIPGRTEFIRPRRSYDLWGTEYFVVPAENQTTEYESTLLGLERSWSPEQIAGRDPSPVPSGDPLPELRLEALQGTANSEPIRVVRNTSVLPRARVVPRAVIMPPLDPTDRAGWLDVMTRLAFPFPGAIPLDTMAIVEDADLHKQHGTAVLGDPESATVPDSRLCRITRDDSSCVEIEAQLDQPGLVILADTYYPGWTLAVASDGQPPVPMPILRVNRLQRGCLLPKGRHQLTYRYQPQSFWYGVIVSGLAWAVWLMAYFWKRPVT